MKERGGLLAMLLAALLLYFWLRFLFHKDPRVPGSFVGSSLGIAGSLLMLVPLAYLVGKRWLRLRGRPLRTFLTVHIYAGLVGPILVMLHTGHKFDSPLGVLLSMMTLVVALSGFVGRYLLQQANRHLNEKQQELARFRPAFEAIQREVAIQAARAGPRRVRRDIFLSQVFPWAVRDPQLREIGRKGGQLARALAVLEMSIGLHEQMRRWLRLWIGFHLTLSTVLYALLAAHVFVVTYYGLRWLPE